MEVFKTTTIIVIIDDCLNKRNGLTHLKDNSFDLGMFDPPWNIGYDGSIGSTYGKTNTGLYTDNIDNYEEWCLSWFKEALRICKIVVLACGRQNLKMWYRISDPDDIFFHFKPNGTYGSRIATFNNADVFLFYGKTKNYYNSNVFFETGTICFLRKYNLIHSSPKNYNVWKGIIEGIKPKSVLDPFVGSGTTIQACKELNIKYCLTYENDHRFVKDIKLRMNKINTNKTGLRYYLKK